MKINSKRFSLSLLAALLSISLWSQSNAAPEQAAMFPGGMPALMEYMIKNLRYPEEAQKAKAEATVYLQFSIEADGTIKDIKTISKGETPRPDLVLEAIRVVGSMPKWIPAVKNGKMVSSEMMLPVKFKLS